MACSEDVAVSAGRVEKGIGEPFENGMLFKHGKQSVGTDNDDRGRAEDNVRARSSSPLPTRATGARPDAMNAGRHDVGVWAPHQPKTVDVKLRQRVEKGAEQPWLIHSSHSDLRCFWTSNKNSAQRIASDTGEEDDPRNVRAMSCGVQRRDLLNSDKLEEFGYLLHLLQPEDFGVDPMLVRAFETKTSHVGHAVSQFLQGPQRQCQEQPKHHSLYKTELCRSFSETGACNYGPACQFSHGISDLRPALRHPKYKTSICKKFVRNGHCPYGSRCRFVHDDDERDWALRERDRSVKHYHDLIIRHEQQTLRLKQLKDSAVSMDVPGRISARRQASRCHNNASSFESSVSNQIQAPQTVRLSRIEPAAINSCDRNPRSSHTHTVEGAPATGIAASALTCTGWLDKLDSFGQLAIDSHY